MEHSELLRMPPREVRLTAAGLVVAAVAVSLLAGAAVSAVWLSLVAVRGAERRQRFEREAVSVTGRVAGMGRVQDEGRRVVRYTYEADGAAHAGGVTMPRREWRRLETGSPLTVRYHPLAPDRGFVSGHERGHFPAAAVPAISLSLALGGVLTAMALRSQRRLLEEGRLAEARVTGSKKHQHGHKVLYEFKDLSGATRTGSYDAAKGPVAAPGTLLTVIYDRDNKRRSARYPLPLVRVRK